MQSLQRISNIFFILILFSLSYFYSTIVKANCSLDLQGGSFFLGDITPPISAKAGDILKTETRDFTLNCTRRYEPNVPPSIHTGYLTFYPRNTAQRLGISGVDIRIYFINPTSYNMPMTTNFTDAVQLVGITQRQFLASWVTQFRYRIRVEIVRNSEPLRSGNIINTSNQSVGELGMIFTARNGYIYNIGIGNRNRPLYVYGRIRDSIQACKVDVPNTVNIPDLNSLAYQKSPMNTLLNEKRFDIGMTCPQKTNVNIFFQDVNNPNNQTENLTKSPDSTSNGYAFTMRYNNAPILMSLSNTSRGTVISKSVEKDIPISIPLSIAYKKISSTTKAGSLISKVQTLVVYQ